MRADSPQPLTLLLSARVPADDAGLVQRCLTALAERFDDDAVKIDTTVD
ncbi:MAG: hypothetical protein IIA67_04330 [Planctomycetes bacterium]|nr:hypothetical protein [Planctomycetota bacterium]